MPPRSRGLETISSALFRARFSYPSSLIQLSSTLSNPRAPTATSRLCEVRVVSQPQQHSFSTTITLHKKGSGGAGKNAKSSVSSSNTGNNTQTGSKNQTAVDPHDHTALQAGIDRALSRLRDALSQTRHAGRVTVTTIEDLRVALPSTSTSSSSSATDANAKQSKARLGDVATVIARGGRSISVLCTDTAHVRAIMSAIQSSGHSLTPSADTAENPLSISFAVPPATEETRAQARAEAKKWKERAEGEVRLARGDAQKALNRWEKEKTVGVDEIRKGRAGMEKVVKAGMEEAAKIVDTAVKSLER